MPRNVVSIQVMKHLVLFSLFLLACPAWAQDFEQFKNAFPASTQKPEKWVFDSTYLAMCEKNLPTLKPIPYEWTKKFIFDKISLPKGEPVAQITENSASLFSHSLSNSSPKTRKKTHLIAYYFLQKIEMSPNFLSFLVYYKDKKKGVVDERVLLLHYTPAGELVSMIDAVSYFTFIDTSLKTTEIRQDFSVCNIEYSYSHIGVGKPEVATYQYYQLNPQTASYSSIQEKYFPFSGLFFSEEEQHEVEVEQNYQTFYVIEGKKGDEIRLGVAVLEYDIEKGTFKAQTMYGDEWAGEFSADKDTLTITKPFTKSIYKRIK
jgi:hypothetical protein